MNRIEVKPIDDPGLDWGRAGAGLGRYMRSAAKLGADGALANARFDLLALQLGDRAFPIVRPSGPQACWLTSLATTYGRALRDEISY